MYAEDDGGFLRRETDNFRTGRTGVRTGWTVNNMLRGDEGPGHFPEDEEEEDFGGLDEPGTPDMEIDYE